MSDRGEPKLEPADARGPPPTGDGRDAGGRGPPSGGAGGKAGKPVLYVGRISSSTSRRDLEDLFSRYGKIVALEIKHGGYGFVEFEDNRDADDAQRALNNYRLDGSSLIVEFSRRSGPGESTCFICGRAGHWARECEQSVEKGMDVRSGKCFKCGESGHLARFCRGPSGPPPPRGGGYGGGYGGPPHGYPPYDPYYPPPPPRGGGGYYRDDYRDYPPRGGYGGGGGPPRSPPPARNRSRSPAPYRGADYPSERRE